MTTDRETPFHVYERIAFISGKRSAQSFTTLDEAEAYIANLTQEERDRLQPEIRKSS